jgi:hypothetical protein
MVRTMRILTLLVALLCAANSFGSTFRSLGSTVRSLGSTFRVFGSAGAESQATPANDESPLNPRNIAGIASRTNVADFSMFAEAADVNHRWKMRVKVRGDASNRADEHVVAGEAFLKLRARSWLDVSAGRIIEKWGTGYGWTPTAFVGPSRNPTDPEDRRSLYEGVTMARADVYAKDATISLYALGRGDVAARAYRLVHGTDVSLSYRRDGDRVRAGLSLSRVIGEALEVHAEVARNGSTTQAVAGAQYTIGSTNLIAELFHGTDGLTRSEWDAFRKDVSSDLRSANLTFAPLHMARTYSFLRAYHDSAKWKSDAELIAITNLRDGSTIVRTAVSRRLRPSLSAYAILTEFVGGADSEMRFIQVARMATVGLRVHF